MNARPTTHCDCRESTLISGVSVVGLKASDVERELKIGVDGMIPLSPLVPASLNEGSPIVLGFRSRSLWQV
jgi:hypothetical protein